MQIEAALERYLLQLEADGRSVHTVKQAARFVRLLAAWLALQGHGGEVEELRHELVARFLASRVVRQRADGGARKATSANALRSGVRAFLRFVHEAGYAPQDAGRLVRRARTSAPAPRALGEPECAKLVAALSEARTALERRDRVLFLLMLRAGLRIGSALGLDVEDIDLENATVLLRRVKGGGEATAPIPGDLVALINAHVAGRASGPLFRGSHGGRLGARQVARRLDEWAGRAGIGHARPHGLRHAFGMRAYRRTGDLLVTAQALGHRSVASTQVYARASDAAVRRAIG